MEMDATKFGLNEEDLKDYKEIPPTFNLKSLEVGTPVKFKITSKEPESITFMDKAENKEVSEPVIHAVEQITGVLYTIWLSSKSLRQSLYQLYTKKDGSLKDTTVQLSVRKYQHPKYGDCRAYNVQEIQEE